MFCPVCPFTKYHVSRGYQVWQLHFPAPALHQKCQHKERGKKMLTSQGPWCLQISLETLKNGQRKNDATLMLMHRGLQNLLLFTLQSSTLHFGKAIIEPSIPRWPFLKTRKHLFFFLTAPSWGKKRKNLHSWKIKSQSAGRNKGKKDTVLKNIAKMVKAWLLYASPHKFCQTFTLHLEAWFHKANSKKEFI